MNFENIFQNYKKCPISYNLRNENIYINSTKYILSLLKLIIIFLLIVIIFFFYSNLNIINTININENGYKDPHINNHSLYNIFKYPQISILIVDIENWKINQKQLKNMIDYFLKQKLKDIEILFQIRKLNSQNYYNIIKNYTLFDNRIKLNYYTDNTNNKIFTDKIYDLINKSKGKFILLMNNNINLKENELQMFYNFTKGKEENIFKFVSNNKNTIYLIKSKLLKDIIDKELKFDSFNSLINYIFLIGNPNLNYIYISFSVNDQYSSLVYVSMISILTNKELFTYIIFYLIISDNFSKKNIDFLNSLYNDFDLFNITFIKMDDRYKKAYISRYITQESYYRFSLGELLPNLNKIIYLDSDIIVFKDLTNFYNLNFNGKIILGQVTGSNKSKQNHKYHINCGILLLNLKGMRKNNIEKKVINIINKGFKANYHDQSLLNKYFYKYIDIYPPEFHTRTFNNYLGVKKWNYKSGNIYDNDYLYFAWKYPTIRHYLGNSKFKKKDFINFYDWWYFARKSKYYKKKTNNKMNIFNFTYI